MCSTKTEKESNTVSGSVISVVWLFVFNSAQSSGKKNNWKCDSQDLFERKRVVHFVLHYSRKNFFRKGFDPEIYFAAYDNLHDWVSCLHARNEIGKVFLPLMANTLFVSINLSLKKVAFMKSSCCVILELNKFAYVR